MHDLFYFQACIKLELALISLHLLGRYNNSLFTYLGKYLIQHFNPIQYNGVTDACGPSVFCYYTSGLYYIFEAYTKLVGTIYLCLPT